MELKIIKTIEDYNSAITWLLLSLTIILIVISPSIFLILFTIHRGYSCAFPVYKQFLLLQSPIISTFFMHGEKEVKKI